MRIWRLGAAGALTAALLAAHVTAVVVPATAAPSAPSATGDPQTHVVRAGTSNPPDDTGEPSPENFVHTAFYPQHLRVHPGDTVRFEFTGGYGGWHTATFLGPGGDPAHLFRSDETGLALHEGWLHASPPDGSEGACGRESWWWPAVPHQDACVLGEDTLDGPEDVLSSGVIDRFFSMADTDCPDCLSSDPHVGGAWVLTIHEQLAPGRYEFFCRLHPHMRGVLEVVEPSKPLANPTAEQIATQISADHEAARATAARLSDPAHAYDAVTGTWRVHVGADTPDRRVEILEYLPAVLDDVHRSDTVEFVAASQEPNTVLFHSAKSYGGRDVVHGGFSSTGRCGVSSCTTDAPDTGVAAVDEQTDARFSAVGPFLPYGTVGLAFPWGCDYDDPATGVPGIPIAPFVLPRVQGASSGQATYGCLAGGSLEMTLAPWMAAATRAPGDVVVPGAVHSSGVLLDESLPAWYRGLPDGGSMPSRFPARFPTAGSYDYVCAAHEFMRGRIDVS